MQMRMPKKVAFQRCAEEGCPSAAYRRRLPFSGGSRVHVHESGRGEHLKEQEELRQLDHAGCFRACAGSDCGHRQLRGSVRSEAKPERQARAKAEAKQVQLGCRQGAEPAQEERASDATM